VRRNDWLIGQLPMGMLDDDFFIRFTSMFQELATTLLDGVDNIPNVVDVTVAPAPMVRWLGSWIGVDNVDSSLPVDLQRRIVRESGQILSWRGTHRGLVQFLELVTGGSVEVSDSGGIFVAGDAGNRPPHVTMRVESTGWIREDDFVNLVVDELPANVTYELYVRDRRLWPPQGPIEAVSPAVVMATPAGEVTVAVPIDDAMVDGHAGSGSGANGAGGDGSGGDRAVGGGRTAANVPGGDVAVTDMGGSDLAGTDVTQELPPILADEPDPGEDPSAAGNGAP
jgi:phage tail-like protein